jgi:hypothetical protein
MVRGSAYTAAFWHQRQRLHIHVRREHQAKGSSDSTTAAPAKNTEMDAGHGIAAGRKAISASWLKPRSTRFGPLRAE